jgi:hypothetical protein
LPRIAGFLSFDCPQLARMLHIRPKQIKPAIRLNARHS